MWMCHDCKAEGKPSGFKATKDELEQHFRENLCSSGSYSYGGRKADRTYVDVRVAGGQVHHTLRKTDGWSKLFPASEMVRRPFLVVDRKEETHDTVTLSVAPMDGEDFTYNPGQFLMLGAWGTGEVPISISGRSEDGFIQQTVRNVGRVTAVLNACMPGQVVSVRGPYGHGWEVPRRNDVVIVAGGCGLAPLRGVINYIEEHRTKFGKVAVLVGARSWEDHLYMGMDREWLREGIAINRVTDDTMFVTELIPAAMAGRDLHKTTVLVCGPEVMMKAAAARLVLSGVPEKQIQVSLERYMRCGIGLCLECQCGDNLVCQDGPVFRLDKAKAAWSREVVDLKLSAKPEPNAVPEHRAMSIAFKDVWGKAHVFGNRMNRQSGIGLTAHGFRCQYAKEGEL
jgi:anaerobic sulfite reductase subunit B